MEKDSNFLLGRLRFCLQLRQGKRKRSENSSPEIPIAGWIFETDVSNGSRAQSYLVSVPQTLLKETCDACRREERVRIDRYTLFPSTTTTFVPYGGLLEIHIGGLSVLQGEGDKERPDEDEDEVWTLEQLARKEALDVHLRKLQHNISIERYYTIRGQVAAISPIITLDPSEPFALVQVCEPPCHSCIIVLRREGLALQPAILPGQVLLWKGVQRQAWRIPAVLKNCPHLLPKIPSHVFVVQTVDQIEWWNDDSPSLSQDASIAPQPITCIPDPHLVVLRGRIQKVHLVNMGSKDSFTKGINYLDLLVSPDETGPPRREILRLFVTHFPMSTSLQLSLRPGAVIQATHVHDMGLGNFAACLRSTVHILVLASETSCSNTLSLFDSLLTVETCTPFAYHKIRRTYTDLCLSRHVSSTFLDGLAVRDVPVAAQWVQALLRSGSSHCGNNKTPRMPYAEFFDHGVHCKPSSNEIGCHLSRNEASNSAKLPRLLHLQQIQDIAFSALQEKLERYLQTHEIHAGWTGSVSLDACTIQELLCSDGDSFTDDVRMSSMFTGGIVVSASRDDGGSSCSSLSIYNGHVELPVLLSSIQGTVTADDFVLGRIKGATVSCLCLGSMLTSSNRQGGHHHSDRTRIYHLPTYGSAAVQAGPSSRGPCAVLQLRRGRHIFFASVFAEVETVQSILRTEGPTDTPCANTQDSRLPSIGTCLSPSFNVPEGVSSPGFTGLLVRKRFDFYKMRNGGYSGLTITVAHAPEESSGVQACFSDVSSLQTMECKPTVRLDPAQRIILQRCFTETVGWGCPTEEQVAVALAWWKISSTERQCALLGGGWDERCQGAAAFSQGKAALVRFPWTALQRDEKRGYVRLRCGLDDLSVRTVSFPPPPNEITSGSLTSFPRDLDFVGGTRMWPGMLDRRPARRQFGGIAFGDMLGQAFTSSIMSGVPTCSLADIHRSVCFDLRDGRRLHLAPSLVRQIRGAIFLGVSYCRALAECSKCFACLRSSPGGVKRPGHSQKRNTKNSKNEQQEGVVVSGMAEKDHEVNKQPSFWHIPLPNSNCNPVAESKNGLSSACSVSNPYKSKPQQRVEPLPKESSPPSRPPRTNSTSPSLLVCPNKCNVERYGVIKWECSGTLDDGAGQRNSTPNDKQRCFCLECPRSASSLLNKARGSRKTGLSSPNQCLPSHRFGLPFCKPRVLRLRSTSASGGTARWKNPMFFRSSHPSLEPSI
jgi:hypothetical protein